MKKLFIIMAVSSSSCLRRSRSPRAGAAFAALHQAAHHQGRSGTSGPGGSVRCGGLHTAYLIQDIRPDAQGRRQQSSELNYHIIRALLLKRYALDANIDHIMVRRPARVQHHAADG
jgi:hypothetical protein